MKIAVCGDNIVEGNMAAENEQRANLDHVFESVGLNTPSEGQG